MPFNSKIIECPHSFIFQLSHPGVWQVPTPRMSRFLARWNGLMRASGRGLILTATKVLGVVTILCYPLLIKSFLKLISQPPNHWPNDPRAAILMTPVNETRKYRCSITGLSQGSMSCFVVEEVVYLNVSLTHRFCFRFADIRSFTFFIPLEWR